MGVGEGPRARQSGCLGLIETLKRWGITLYSGVNGGGVIHVVKYLEPFTELSQAVDGVPRFLTMSEYVSGFVPLGYFLASGRIAGSITTTGAATRLAACGLSEAKYHNIPALYLIALNPVGTLGRSPLQDVSETGANVVGQLQAELRDGCVVLDNVNTVSRQLARVRSVLRESRPVALAFHPDVLTRMMDIEVPEFEPVYSGNRRDLDDFLERFPRMAAGCPIVIFVGEEAARCEGIQHLTTELAEILRAPTVWSVNGANAVSPDNRYGFGYVLFGGNDRAVELWRHLDRETVLIALGFDPGEYAINLETLPVRFVWHFTNLAEPYGHQSGEFRHRVGGEYQQVRGDIGRTLAKLLPKLQALCLERNPIELPSALNTRQPSRDVSPGTVDLIAFYEQMHKLWRPNSIAFDDVCVAYKDRQYVTQRPHRHIKFYAAYHGSAMGGSLGLAIGAKLGNPSLHTFAFSGDGCWRLFGGALAEAANLDVRLFILNNESYAIVEKGLETVLPDTDKRRYHSKLRRIDFVSAAVAHGWEAYSVKSDLSNLDEIVDACYTVTGRSILVDVPVDADQVVGLNPRLTNLKVTAHL